MIGRVVGIVLVWLTAAAIIVFRVLDPAHGIILAGVATAVILALPREDAAQFEFDDPPQHSHAGGRRDLSELSWSAFDRDGHVTPQLRTRLAALTTDQPLQNEIETKPAGPVQVLSWLNTIEEGRQWKHH
jgi:hypothetical protein